MNHDPIEGHATQSSGNGRWKIVFAVFAVIAAFFLLTEHRAHVFGFLPYLLILACPLMHLFHGGHGGHGNHGARRDDGSHGNEPRPGRPDES
jgi:hypothetical protein